MEITDKGVLKGSFMDFTIPTEFAKHALFYIPQYGHFRCDDLYDIRRESMSNWLLLACVRRGALYFESGGCNFTAPAGSVVLLDCRTPHRYHCKDEADFLWFHFAGNSTEAYANLLCEPTCRVFPEAGLESLFQHLFSRAQDIPYSEHLISADIHRLLGRLASPDHAAAGISPIRPALTYIQAHFAGPLSLEDLAAQCNMSVSYFIRSFQRYLGRTPHEYLLAFRLLKAKQLLLSDDRSIEQIAEACGFNSASHFARAFRKSSGISPSAFRQMQF